MTIKCLLLVFISILGGCITPVREYPFRPTEEPEFIRQRYERSRDSIGQIIRDQNCVWTKADTAVDGILIRDVDRVKLQMKVRNSTFLDFTPPGHELTSNDKTEKLLVVEAMAGDPNPIMFIEVAWIHPYNQHGAKEGQFVTSRGIRLGLSKKELLNRLGTCYIFYGDQKLEHKLLFYVWHPAATTENFLQKTRFPAFFVIYTLKEGRVHKMQFAFEYTEKDKTSLLKSLDNWIKSFLIPATNF